MCNEASLTPLYDAVSAYLSKNPARFHMPGHGGVVEALPFFGEALSFDLTEIPGLDSLYEAQDCILRSERLAAELYGAARTLYSAGGSTLCIQTMLALTAGGGGTVLFGRNLHRSALAACALLDIAPVFLMPDFSGTLSADSVAAALAAHPDAKAVFVTSPDYLGRITDLAPIAALCRGAGIPLLVDAAHGAHLPFLDPAINPLSAGADMCANSAHKTLPALTPGAFLHIAQERYVDTAKSRMALFGSTSPSYPVLLSLEACCCFLRTKGRAALAELARRTAALRDAARGLYPLTENQDPVRLTLEPWRAGISGRDAAAFLSERGISCEYADDRYVVFILTPFHGDADFARLESALRALESECPRISDSREFASLADFQPPAPSMGLRQALFAPSLTLPTDKTVGRIAAEAACPCPPGIPVVVPGERITEKSAFLLNAYGVFQLKVVK